MNKVNKNDFNIPNITAVETIDGTQAKALLLGYSWDDCEDGVQADSISAYKAEYTKENTLIIDGEMGENIIALSAENPMTASYEIYLPNGMVYDNGKRELYDSLNTRLYWTDDKTGIGIIAPFVPGVYIYKVTIKWEQNNLNAIYGIKVVMTGTRNAYDEAISVIWNNYNEALSVSFKGVSTLPGAEYAGNCYIFEVELPNGTVQAAMSKKNGTSLIYSGGNWHLNNKS